ncbi:signal-transducing adaptor protein 1-like [Xiphias gladius]|uniref:signal-transducing adaptor protein 1-like n=1 Tax=Xiphias gladius TaxID=8245 RepID=UPI001A9864E4|nr:signal-transducing adaptor protein 1-like [Xiphias gladius]
MSVHPRVVHKRRVTITALPLYYSGQLLKKHTEERVRTKKRKNQNLPPRPTFLLSASSSPSPPPAKDKQDHHNPNMPLCFFDVTRQEAERMLEANLEYGSIILRPSTLANYYALTLRKLTPSGPVVKNYRVTSTNSGFVIEYVVTVFSLNDVLKYFLDRTDYRLHPYVASQPYDTRIEVSPAPKCISITSPTPKTVPKAEVAPMPRSQTAEEPDDHNLKDSDICVFLSKLVQLDSELRRVLNSRRENIYSASGEEEDSYYENPTTEKPHSCTTKSTAV